MLKKTPLELISTLRALCASIATVVSFKRQTVLLEQKRKGFRNSRKLISHLVPSEFKKANTALLLLTTIYFLTVPVMGQTHSTQISRSDLPKVELKSLDELLSEGRNPLAPLENIVEPLPLPECGLCDLNAIDINNPDGEVDIVAPNCVTPDGPCIFEARAFQVGYSDEGGIVSVVWRTRSNDAINFEHFFVCVEKNGVARIDGNQELNRGVELPPLPPGETYRIVVSACVGGRTVQTSTQITVRRRSPVPPVEIIDWFSYGFTPETERGVLDLELHIENRVGNLEEFDYEVYINDQFRGVISNNPFNRIAISNLRERVNPNFYKIQLVPFLGPYAAQQPAVVVAEAKALYPPRNLECEFLGCVGNVHQYELNFEFPRSQRLSGVIPWIRNQDDPNGEWEMFPLQSFEEVQIDEIFNRVRAKIKVPEAIKPGTPIYLTGVQFRSNTREPRFLTNVPWSKVSTHAITRCGSDEDVCIIPNNPLFRRGDANSNSNVDISDVITVLNFLFVGSVQITCPDAADINDDGKIDISDPVNLLGFLFLGTIPELKAPGSRQCGEDPTEDRYKECIHPPCNDIGIDPIDGIGGIFRPF